MIMYYGFIIIINKKNDNIKKGMPHLTWVLFSQNKSNKTKTFNMMFFKKNLQT